MTKLCDDAPRFDGLIGIGGTEGDETGDRAQRCKLLDRLMRRAIFADADRIVREDVNDGNLHQRAEPDCGAGIVAEDQKS